MFMIKIKNENSNKISYRILRVAMRIGELDVRTRNYGTDVLISMAEIHIIQAVAKASGASVTDLAGILGITKGAVSQLLFKLEKKGLIVKHTDASNASRMNIVLTEKGEVANREHERIHQEFDQIVKSILSNYSLEECDIFDRIFTEIEEKVNHFEE